MIRGHGGRSLAGDCLVAEAVAVVSLLWSLLLLSPPPLTTPTPTSRAPRYPAAPHSESGQLQARTHDWAPQPQINGHIKR